MSDGVPFAQGSNKLICIASLKLWRRKEIESEKWLKLYELDPKPKDLIVSRLIIKNWRAELLFVASNLDDLRLGVKS